jgi:hypothetical protein
MKKIYIHIPDKEKRTTLEKICAEQDISIHELSLKDVNRTVAAVCGMPMKANGPHKTAPAMYMLPEILLFYGIDDHELDSFLDAYNATGTAKIQRKAVVTPTNLGWTLFELAEELGKEIA